MLECLSSPLCKAAVHLLALVVLLCTFLVLHLLVSPAQRRFFCDDQSLMYPKHGSTVPYYVCILVSLGLGPPTFAIVEWLRRLDDGAKRTEEEEEEEAEDRRRLGSLLDFCRSRGGHLQRHAPLYSSVVYAAFYFLLGMAACEVVTIGGKTALGRPRPHFLAVCRLPAPCNASVANAVSDCRPVLPASELDEARRAFPSGHASFSAYSAVYISLFVERRWRGDWRLVKAAYQYLLLLAAAYVACSRVADYKHHATDVLGGCLLGAGVAYATTLRFAAARRLRRRQQQQQQQQPAGGLLLQE